ncbi:TRAP transporter large permease [Sneathiella chinensis]|uniref:TRAP transporter large permease protein n=1 Tax=Sneathiella chinensis TaxID=349750 RepID=A0ABQ5U5Y0_9PROT|nr:TRAP transporter large permease subunit [Sneathiella chinensis]GLQ05891.1 C4-dicarboxylate ABC transporter permease [Sneathiella chinensis]
MTELATGLIVLFLIFFYLGLGVWVFIGLISVSLTVQFFILDMSPDTIGAIATKIMVRSASSWELAAIPMFIWMGDIIFRTDISRRLFDGLAPIVNIIPGRLLHANIVGCTVFAAVSGSSTATAVTVGKISLEELSARGYDRSLAVGSLAGAGSLGLLIPPSIVMIVYGILAEVSIISLFAAGVLPGLMIAALYSGYISLRAKTGDGIVPQVAEGGGGNIPRVRLADLVNLLPVALLIVVVLGSIYSGLATPSEAAAIGVLAALVIAFVTGQLSLDLLTQSVMSSVKMSAMVVSLVVAAALLSTTMGYLHLPQNVATMISGMELSPYALIALLAAFYVLLGLFLEGISITVMSLPITLPLIVQAGFDPLWFGVFLILMVELATITPPVGFNLFVLQGLTNMSISQIARASMPFFLLLCVGVVLLTLFPEIALWLPETIRGGGG